MTALARRLAWNVGLVMSGRAAGVAVNAATLMFIARSLGPASFGVYAVAFVYVSFFSNVIDSGINITVTRALTRNPDAAPRLLGNAILLKAVTGTLLMALAIAVAELPYFAADLRAVVPVASGLILVTSLSVVNALFQVRLRVSWIVAGDLVMRLTFLVLALAVLGAGGGVASLLLTQVAAVTLGLLVTLGRAFWLVPPDFTPDLAIWRTLLRPAVPLSIALALGAVASRFDVLVLSAYATQREVGVYSAAFRVVDLMLLVPGLMMQVVFPVLVDRSEGDLSRLEHAYRRLADLLALIGLPLAIFLTVFARDVLAIVGGSAYSDGGPYLAVLAWGMLAVFLSNGMFFVLLATGRQRATLVWTAAGAGTSIMASLLLVTHFGGTGVAAASLLAHTVVLAGFSAVLWHDLGIRPWPRVGLELGLVGAVVAAVGIAVRVLGGGVGLATPLVALAVAITLWASQRTRNEIREILTLP